MLNLEWLKEIEVIKHDFAYEIMAESTRESLFCHHCFKFDVIGHGIKKQLVNDTPMHGKKVVIRVLRKRFRCKDCGKTFMEELPDIDDKRLATKRLVEWVSKRAIDHTFTSVAHDTGLNEKTVRNIFEDYAAGLNKQFKVVTPITNAYTESVNGIIKIVNRNGRGYSFSALRTKILFAEKAHKRESKSIRSLLSERGDKKHLGFMTDESLNYGVHMPTLIKMEEDGEF